MFLAHSVFGKDGRILLKKGTRLTDSYLKRLEKLNCTHLYVYETPDENWNCTGPVSDRIRSEAMQVLWQSLISVVERRPLDEKQINFVVEGIFKDVLAQDDCLFQIIDIKTPDNYLYNHSLNVCVLSILMAKHLNYDGEQMKEIALGAFLHDLGKAYFTAALKKNEDLSVMDTVQIKQHTKRGFDLLREVPGFSPKVANIAYQHHEREDGSGYPLGLIGVDIPLYSKIVATADSFDAMTSQRVYRESLWNDRALQELTDESPAKYDPKVVAALTRSVARYPLGSVVQLTNGQQAGVVAVSGQKIVLQNRDDLTDVYELPAAEWSRIEKRLH